MEAAANFSWARICPGLMRAACLGPLNRNHPGCRGEEVGVPELPDIAVYLEAARNLPPAQAARAPPRAGTFFRIVPPPIGFLSDAHSGRVSAAPRIEPEPRSSTIKPRVTIQRTILLESTKGRYLLCRESSPGTFSDEESIPQMGKAIPLGSRNRKGFRFQRF